MFLQEQLRDALNRAQTNNWQEYVHVTAALKTEETSDTGIPPRGLSDDEELRRLGEVEGADELMELFRGNVGPDYGS